MQKAIHDFLFGLCFGLGLIVAYGVARIIAGLFGQGHIGGMP